MALQVWDRNGQLHVSVTVTAVSSKHTDKDLPPTVAETPRAYSPQLPQTQRRRAGAGASGELWLKGLVTGTLADGTFCFPFLPDTCYQKRERCERRPCLGRPEAAGQSTPQAHAGTRP